VGVLRRRQVAPSAILFIEKETNRLEEVQQGLIQDWEDVYSLVTVHLQLLKPVFDDDQRVGPAGD
jgi:hypothetical protein